MTLHIGMLTSEGRPRATLLQSVRSVQAIPDSRPSGSTFFNLNTDYERYPSKAWARLFKGILDYQLSDTVLMLEDDVTWLDVDGSRLSALLAQPLLREPDFGCVSLYCPRKCSRLMEEPITGSRLQPGIHRLNQPLAAWGSQALLFTRASALKILDALTVDTRHIDYLVFRAIQRLHLTLHYHIPCLVSHDLGRANSATYDNTHETTIWLLESDYCLESQNAHGIDTNQSQEPSQ